MTNIINCQSSNLSLWLSKTTTGHWPQPWHWPYHHHQKLNVSNISAVIHLLLLNNTIVSVTSVQRTFCPGDNRPASSLIHASLVLFQTQTLFCPKYSGPNIFRALKFQQLIFTLFSLFCMYFKNRQTFQYFIGSKKVFLLQGICSMDSCPKRSLSKGKNVQETAVERRLCSNNYQRS